jgi:hypothetical protein
VQEKGEWAALALGVLGLSCFRCQCVDPEQVAQVPLDLSDDLWGGVVKLNYTATFDLDPSCSDYGLYRPQSSD